MAPSLRLREMLPILLSLAPLTLGQTVSIEGEIPDGHACIEECLDYNYITDVGDALNCGRPYENDCYCGTASATASVVSAFINECASDRCAAGDLTRDISSIRRIYAGYCNGAGFTQPIISEWFTAADGPDDSGAETTATDPGSDEDTETTTTTEPESTGDESESGPPETTTILTLVTETTSEEEGGATGPRVSVHVTSTIYMSPEGSIVSGPGDGSSGGDSDNSKTIALGVGLGVGLAVLFALVGVGAWLCIRKRRNAQGLSGAHGHASSPPTTIYPQPTHDTHIARKPVPTALSTPTPLQSETTELSGHDVKSEISGREIHHLADATQTSPYPAPSQHEMEVRNWPQNMEAPRGYNVSYELPGR